MDNVQDLTEQRDPLSGMKDELAKAKAKGVLSDMQAQNLLIAGFCDGLLANAASGTGAFVNQARAGLGPFGGDE